MNRIMATAPSAMALSLVACGGQAPAYPDNALFHQWIADRGAAHASWMKPGTASHDLLYVSAGGGLYVFLYPSGYTVGFLSLPSQPQGECVDGSSGSVFAGLMVTGSAYSEGEVYEYAHAGTKPLAILKDGSAEPMGCSVDPATGNLAVTNYCSEPSCPHGNVAIYAQAKGTPKTYEAPNFTYYFYCGYDDEGNLFIDGYGDRYGEFRFAELVKGSSGFKNITLKQKIAQPGQVQWDGHDMAIGAEGGVIYRTNDSGEILGTTSLLGPGKAGRVLVRQFWIAGSTVIGPGRTVRFWRYPAGGHQVKELSSLFPSYGVAVSLAK